MSDPSIILASASPRRRALLASVGLQFQVDPADLDEEQISESNPERQALILAQTKANHIARRYSAGLVIGADTIVVIDGQILNKPADVDEATSMLNALSGRTHRVITAVAVVDASTRHCESDYETTLVTFRSLSQAQIAKYVATGEPFDKAGGYGIQGRGALLVARIEGCYPNVVGLPLVTMARLFAHFGVEII